MNPHPLSIDRHHLRRNPFTNIAVVRDQKVFEIRVLPYSPSYEFWEFLIINVDNAKGNQMSFEFLTTAGYITRNQDGPTRPLATYRGSRY